MRKAQSVIVLGLALVAAGCQSNAQFLDANQAAAEQMALKRGQFEMSCTTATPTVLSREVVEPAIAEYTIGVSGCDDRKTFVVLCPDGGNGCFAAGPGRFYGEQ